jgi:hypothetical protein
MNLYVSGQYAVPDGYAANVRAYGVAPWPNYERNLTELISDRSVGQAAGHIGFNDAVRAGFPADGTVWFPFSVDVNLPPSDYPKVGAAFDGINDIIKGRFLVACYGQGGLIDYLHNTHRTQGKGWLSGSASYPGFNVHSPNVCLVQSHDSAGNWLNTPVASSDINTITDVASLHAWWPTNSPYGVDLMALELADLQAEMRYVLAYLTKGANTHYGPAPEIGGLPAVGGVKVTSGITPVDIPTLTAQLTPVIQAAIAAHPSGQPDAAALAAALAQHLSVTAH